MAVKANQAHLLENIEDEFKFAKPLNININEDLVSIIKVESAR